MPILNQLPGTDFAMSLGKPLSHLPDGVEDKLPKGEGGVGVGVNVDHPPIIHRTNTVFHISLLGGCR